MRDLDAVVWSEFAAAVMVNNGLPVVDPAKHAEYAAKLADAMMIEFRKRFPEKE